MGRVATMQWAGTKRVATAAGPTDLLTPFDLPLAAGMPQYDRGRWP